MSFVDHQAPPGFEMHSLVDADELRPTLSLYLPCRLADRLSEAKGRALQELQMRRDAEQAAAAAAPSRRFRSEKAGIDVEQERAAVKVPDPSTYSGRRFPVYGAYEPVEMLARSRAMADARDRERVETIYRRVADKRNNLRQIAWPDDIRSDLNSLARRLPHFRAVTNFVQERLNVAADHNLPPRIPPILLTGAPGLGKTHYCRELAAVLRTTVRVQPYDNAETTSVLLGSDRHWGNTQHGALFDLLALEAHANPIVILDELDKSRPRPSGLDPLAPLHSILEPSTASSLRDLSLDFTLDASLVTFIATANDEWRIPETLRSRFRIFRIDQPDGEDAIMLAHEVLRSVLARFGIETSLRSRRLAAAVAHLPARETLKALEDAAMRMLSDGRRELTLGDIRLENGDQQITWLH